MADLVLIPVVILIIYKLQYNKTGFYDDYLSIERSTILRGIMILNVVLFHCCLDYIGVEHKLLSICQGDDAVKIFYFLSGYGLVVSYKKRGTDYLKGFFSKRFVKILVPFILVAVLQIIYFKYTNDFYGIGEFSLETVFDGFVRYGYPIVYNSWYVIELLVLYVVFFVSFKIEKDTQSGVNLAVILTMLVMCGFFALHYYKGWTHIWFYSTYAFAFGMALAAKEKEIVFWLQKKYDNLIMFALPIVFIAIILRKIFLSQFTVDQYIQSKNLILGPLIILGVLIGSMKFKVNCKVWKFLGEISYELFLVHGLAYNGLRPYIQNDILFILAVVFSSVAVAAALHYLCRAVFDVYFKLIDKQKKDEKENI